MLDEVYCFYGKEVVEEKLFVLVGVYAGSHY